MARTDAIVLGAGIVGVSVALHLAKRGLSVALVDARGVGRADLLRQCRRHRGQARSCRRPFRASLSALLRVALQARERGQLSSGASCRSVAPWLLAFRAASRPERIARPRGSTGRCLRARVAEHETLMAEAGALALFAQDRLAEDLPQRTRLRRRWRRSSIWRARFGIAAASRSTPHGARALEPSLTAGVPARGVLAAGGEPVAIRWR